MSQKRNNIARKAITLLSVLSIAISFFAMSPTLTYANGSQFVTIKIWRPFVSKVGSVLVTDKTQPNVINNKCVPLPNQGTLVPLPTQGDLGSQDTISMQNFPDGNCQTPVNDLAHRNPMNDYQDLIITLPPCSDDTVCRVYMTPNEA